VELFETIRRDREGLSIRKFGGSTLSAPADGAAGVQQLDTARVYPIILAAEAD
jgi:hypothetical protein